MPIMAAHGRNDARGAARLLASTARDCINDPATAPGRVTPLNNAFRLLEAYRANPFFGLERSGKRYPQGSAEKLTITPPVERHVKEVRKALEDARIAAFSGQSKEKAIKTIEGVLKGIAYPETFKRPSTESRRKAAQFFEEVQRRLQLG